MRAFAIVAVCSGGRRTGRCSEQYCSECHNATDWAGGVAFDTMSPDNIGDDAEVWEHAVRKLRGNLMPPPGKPQPSRAELQQFVSVHGRQAG